MPSIKPIITITSPSSSSDLPPELWLEIFSYLEYHDLSKVLLVSTYFNAILIGSGTGDVRRKQLDINFFRETLTEDHVDPEVEYFWDIDSNNPGAHLRLHPLLHKVFRGFGPEPPCYFRVILEMPGQFSKLVDSVLKYLEKPEFKNSRIANENACSPARKTVELYLEYCDWPSRYRFQIFRPDGKAVIMYDVMRTTLVVLLNHWAEVMNDEMYYWELLGKYGHSPQHQLSKAKERMERCIYNKLEVWAAKREDIEPEDHGIDPEKVQELRDFYAVYQEPDPNMWGSGGLGGWADDEDDGEVPASKKPESFEIVIYKKSTHDQQSESDDDTEGSAYATEQKQDGQETHKEDSPISVGWQNISPKETREVEYEQEDDESDGGSSEGWEGEEESEEETENKDGTWIRNAEGRMVRRK